jgi:hypothetical protein
MANLVEMNATMTCPHQGRIMPSGSAPSARVSLGGQPALKGTAPVYTIAGCAFTTPDGTPKPCTTAQWTVNATRVRIEGMPALLSISTGVTIGPLGMQGAPSVMMSQVRVTGQ